MNGGRAECPLCDYAAGVDYFNARHADKEHTRCSCGWVGVKWRSHVAQLARHGKSGCTILELVPGPGGQEGALSYRQLRSEVDRLKCELIVFADVDTADVEQLRVDVEFYRGQSECYRSALLSLIEAGKHNAKAYELLLQAERLRRPERLERS